MNLLLLRNLDEFDNRLKVLDEKRTNTGYIVSGGSAIKETPSSVAWIDVWVPFGVLQMTLPALCALRV